MALRLTPVPIFLATAGVGTSFLAHGQQVTTRTAAALSAAPARAAGRLTGTATSSATGQALAYAAVAVLTDAGTLAAGSVCGAQGQFGLPGLAPGVYALRSSWAK